MAESSNDKLFRTKVLPIMDKVMADLRHKQLEEIGRHTTSLPYILAAAAGPDGGMAAQAASLDTLRYTGKWNSKHTEDYIQMVKDELKKQKINVTPEIEKKMIDKMIKDEIPKSSIEYIMKKAATSTLFYLPQALNKSPLENHISEQAEKRYNPKGWEKGTGWALGATADFLSTGGMGGGWGTAAKFVAVDVAMNAGLDALGSSADDDVPLIIAPEHRADYKKQKENQAAKPENKPQSTTTEKQEVKHDPPQEQSGEKQNETVTTTTQLVGIRFRLAIIKKTLFRRLKIRLVAHLMSHHAAQHIGIGQIQASKIMTDFQHIFLINHHAVCLFQQILQDWMLVIDTFRMMKPINVFAHHARLGHTRTHNGTGCDKRLIIRAMQFS